MNNYLDNILTENRNRLERYSNEFMEIFGVHQREASLSREQDQ